MTDGRANPLMASHYPYVAGTKREVFRFEIISVGIFSGKVLTIITIIICIYNII